MKGGWTRFFAIVSMNSLFIYLFSHAGWSEIISSIFCTRLLLHYLVGEENLTAEILTSLLVWGALWGLCYWMYQKRLFIKI